MLKPLYFWESGTVQIADLVLTVGLLFYVFIKHGRIVINRSSAIALQYLFLVILYQTIVNCLWYFFIRESSLLKASLYYIFNFSAFFITLAIAEEGSLEQIKKSIAIGSFLSVIITLFGLIVVQGGSRKTGFFNNPNQLGYYAVIMLTVLLYLKEYMNKWQRIVVFIGSIWAIIVSLSKAAIFGSFGLLIIYFDFYQKNLNIKSIIKQFIFILFILSF